MKRVLGVWSNGIRVGTISDEDDVWTFEYDPGWISREDSFDLSPALARNRGRIVDGASVRPVQWYFDNLLPEDRMREVLAKEADIPWQDAFGLLAYFGAESAGSLVLLDPEHPSEGEQGLAPLSDAVLSARINNLPNASLTHDAPKKMSLAGAQHKLLVVLRDGQLYEPLRGTPSTWILKPPHQSARYPASVINEYFTMRLAKALGLAVPKVELRYVPEPVYLIERFDRIRVAGGGHGRLHVIDSCQLLNKAPSFKYLGANVDALLEAIGKCLGPAAARQRLFEWMVFNVLVGNGDNHLKNVSFMVDRFGVTPAPAYDLLCTAVYETRALAGDKENWPHTELALTVGEARRFSAVTRAALVAAGLQVGLAETTVQRVLDRFVDKLPGVADRLVDEVIATSRALIESCADPARARTLSSGDQRLLDAIRHIIIRDMSLRLK